jgi:rod shape-determining protein MreC
VTLHAGDQVTSSGDGGLLPAGLPIGTVVADGSDGWRVALLADAASSQDVEVLNFSKPPEALPASAQLPAEAAGLKPQAPPPPAPVASATPAPTAPAPKPKPPVAVSDQALPPPAEAEEMDR